MNSHPFTQSHKWKLSPLKNKVQSWVYTFLIGIISSSVSLGWERSHYFLFPTILKYLESFVFRVCFFFFSSSSYWSCFWSVEIRCYLLDFCNTRFMGISIPLALPLALKKQSYSALGMPNETSSGQTQRKQEENSSEQGNITMKTTSRLWIIEPLVKLINKCVLSTCRERVERQNISVKVK